MIEHSVGIEKIIQKRINEGFGYLEILKRNYGADPREVWDVFRKYSDKPVGETKKLGINNLYPDLPEPHPAYSQWRLSPASGESFIKKINEKNYDKVCFLGCPVLGRNYSKNKLLLDIDKTGLCGEGAVYNINESLPEELKEKFNCVVTDPPWYSEETKLFISRAAGLAKEGGTIYTSLPGLLTRPSIVAERLDFQKWLSENNLVLAEINSSVVYEVPPFEDMAYLDIPDFTGELWRKGDWLKIKKAGKFLDEPVVVKEEKWQEFLFGNKRVFLKYSVDNSPERMNLTEPTILNSVSKRNSKIHDVDVWSSRNAVLHINVGYNDTKRNLKELESEYSKTGKLIGKEGETQKLIKLILI